MASPKRILIGVIAIAMCLSAGGCAAKAEKLRRKNDLLQIGLAYHMWWSSYGEDKGPKNADDLQPFLLDVPATYQKLQDGWYVVAWNASLKETTKAGSTAQHVLAYEADVPQKGGQVVFADGHVEEMTADAFGGAKKAVEVKKE
jgi:prepilin-type processing-associated H-X9-DG protein